jgi:4-amino-4-deoxy-L-arabinose transferase-like glycosyltransferase
MTRPSLLPTSRCLAPAGLIAIGLLALLPGNRHLPLIDRDEPRFAQATREMMDRGEWMIPYFNGDYRFDKPVLSYWLMRGGYALFGVNEFGARFHSVICSIGVALALLAMGRRWFGGRAGWMAGAAFLLSIQVLIHGRSASADMPMILAVTLTHLALYELLRERPPEAAPPGGGWFWLLYGSLGLGFLAKGPVAWLIPLLSLLLWRWGFGRRPLPWSRLRAGWGLPVTLALVGAWGMPALLATGGQFWAEGINKHVVQRGLEAFNSRAFLPVVYYPATACLSLFPWIAFLGPIWAVVRRQRSPAVSFLLSWLVAPYIVFTFYATQLPHYVMPAFPAFFLLLGRALDQGPREPRWSRYWAGFIFAAFGIAAAALAAVGLGADLPPSLAGLRVTALGLAAVLASLAGIAVLARGRRWIPAAGLVPVTALGLALGAYGLSRQLPGVQLADRFRSMPPGSAFLAFQYREPSLVFYAADREWEMVAGPDAVRAFLAEPGPRLAVFLEEERTLDDYLKWRLAGAEGPAPARSYRDLWRSLDPDGFTVHTLEGINFARSSLVRLHLLTRGALDSP